MKENKEECAVWERKHILVKASGSRGSKRVEEPTMQTLGKSERGGNNGRCKGPEAQ